LPAGPDPPLTFAGCQPITGQCFGNAGGVGDYNCPAGRSPRSAGSQPSAPCTSQNCTADEQMRRNGECCVVDDDHPAGCSQCNNCVAATGSVDTCRSFGVDCDCYDPTYLTDASLEVPADDTLEDKSGSLVIYAVGTVLLLAACLLLCGMIRCCIWSFAHPAGPRKSGKSNTVRPEPRLQPAQRSPSARMNTLVPSAAMPPGNPSLVSTPTPPAQALPPLKLRGREQRLAKARGAVGALPPIQRNPVGPAPTPPPAIASGGPGGLVPKPPLRPSRPTAPP
jgi:hypothetical protein